MKRGTLSPITSFERTRIKTLRIRSRMRLPSAINGILITSKLKIGFAGTVVVMEELIA
jgi:ABC-type nitrate/sulfonate/bicarbonate transport system permease component